MLAVVKVLRVVPPTEDRRRAVLIHPKKRPKVEGESPGGFGPEWRCRGLDGSPRRGIRGKIEFPNSLARVK